MPTKVRKAEFVEQLREALKQYSAYHIVDNLIDILHESTERNDVADANVLEEILNQLH